MSHSGWETVIGLEVHVQLATKTKIFSGASTTYGAEPNTQACAIDLAMPGTLPVLNKQAVHYAVMFGLAIDAEIGKDLIFWRQVGTLVRRNERCGWVNRRTIAVPAHHLHSECRHSRLLECSIGC